jgi:hypothetical protein
MDFRGLSIENGFPLAGIFILTAIQAAEIKHAKYEIAIASWLLER